MCGTANLTCLAQKPLLEICFSGSLSCWRVVLGSRSFQCSSVWVWPAFSCQPSSTINVYVYMTLANHDYDNDFFCIFQLFFWHPLESVGGHGGGMCVIGSPSFFFEIEVRLFAAIYPLEDVVGGNDKGTEGLKTPPQNIMRWQT